MMGTRLQLYEADRVMVLAPHPDDEILGAGGLLRRATALGASVSVLLATDGEGNPWPQRLIEMRWRIGHEERQRWGAKRREESLRGLGCVGVSPDRAGFLGWSDQGLTELLLGGGEALASIVGELRLARPTILVSPSLRDRHPDHSGLAVLLRLAREFEGAPRLELEYSIHEPRLAPPSAGRFGIDLDAEERRAKRRAILCHRTQLVLRRRFCLRFARGYEAFAEPFADAGPHPVQWAEWSGSSLRLEIHGRSPWLRRSPPRLLLVALDDHGEIRCWSVALDCPERAAVRDASSGAEVGAAALDRAGATSRVVIGGGELRASRLIFAKVDDRVGVFDVDGWRALPLPERAAQVGTVGRTTGVG